jgi:hypothetical protein
LLRVSFVAGLAIGRFGVAKDGQIGSAALTLPSPQGYCELSEQQPADARLIHVIGDLVAGTRGEGEDRLLRSLDSLPRRGYRDGNARPPSAQHPALLAANGG